MRFIIVFGRLKFLDTRVEAFIAFFIARRLTISNMTRQFSMNLGVLFFSVLGLACGRVKHPKHQSSLVFVFTFSIFNSAISSSSTSFNSSRLFVSFCVFILLTSLMTSSWPAKNSFAFFSPGLNEVTHQSISQRLGEKKSFFLHLKFVIEAEGIKKRLKSAKP